MRRIRPTSKAAALLLAVLLLSAPGAAAQELDPTDASLIAAFERLNFDSFDMELVFANTLDLEEPTLFNFASSLDPPTIDPESEPWGVPTRIGFARAVWMSDEDTPQFPDEPSVIDDALFVASGGPESEVEYLLMWAQVDGVVPIEEPLLLFQNWSFPIAVPGGLTWTPTEAFPYDTWANSSSMPFMTYGPNPWNLGLNEVQADGTLAAAPFSGFGLIAADTIVLGVDSANIAGADQSDLLFGFAAHIHDGGFGATEESESLIAFGTGMPGELWEVPESGLLDVGNMAPPTTTTSAPTTTTSTASDTTEATDDLVSEGSGPPLLAVLLGLSGLAAAAVGARFLLASRSDPCSTERDLWESSLRDLEVAESQFGSSIHDVELTSQLSADLEKQLEDLCWKWPTACEDDETSSSEDDQDSNVSPGDLHALRVGLGRLWDDFRRGEVGPGQIREAWRQVDGPEYREELSAETDRQIENKQKLQHLLSTSLSAEEERRERSEEAKVALFDAQSAADMAYEAYRECLDNSDAEKAVAPAVRSSLLESESPEDPEDERAWRLVKVIEANRGSRDLAAVALDLYHFNNWHLRVFDEPWFSWSPDPTPSRTVVPVETRTMSSTEFVHFCAYLSGTQSGVGPNVGEELMDDGRTLESDAPRGSVITGSLKWGDYNNTADYYHAAISLGDAKVLSLGVDGLILEEATGHLTGAFPEIRYSEILVGSYQAFS